MSKPLMLSMMTTGPKIPVDTKKKDDTKPENDVKPETSAPIVIEHKIEDIHKEIKPIKIYEKADAKAVEGGIQKEAADNMKKIAKHVKEHAAKKTNKEANSGILKVAVGGATGTVAGAGLAVGVTAGVLAAVSAPISLPVIAIAGIVGAVAGLVGGGAIGAGLTVKNISDELTNEAAANNFLRQAEHTKEEHEKTVIEANNPLKKFALRYTDTDSAKLTPEQIEKAADELELPEKIRSIYIQKPTQEENSQAVVHYSETDIRKYKNVGDDERNFEGRKDAMPIAVNRAYYDSPTTDLYKDGLLAEFSKKENLSPSEAKRFLELAKALSTNNKFTRTVEDKVAPDALEKEDTDFFDINNDRNMNFEDIKLLHTLLKAKAMGIPLYSQLPDNMKAFNFDTNGDGKCDEEDEKMYKYALKKADINSDGDFNKTDETILAKYLLSRIKLAKSFGETHDTLMESLGFDYNTKSLSLKKTRFLLNLEDNILGLYDENNEKDKKTEKKK